jgi:MATE family multidrug resistance protein
MKNTENQIAGQSLVRTVKPSYSLELKRLLVISLPLVLAQIAQNATSLVDTIMVGKLGEGALAGIAIGSTVFMFVSIVASGVVLGVSSVVSQAVGAGNKELTGRAVRQGFWLSLILTIPAMLIFWNIQPILLALRQPAETAAASSQYLRAISFGLFPSLCAFAMRGLLEGHSNTRPILVVAVVSVALNVFLNDTLMFGRYGLPKFGLVGTGIASAIVLWLIFGMYAAYCNWKYGQLEIFSRLKSPDAEMLRELVRVGGPIGISLAFEASMFSAAGIAMGTLGTTELAAHQIALQTASISFMIPLGISIAASARIGQFVGAGDRQSAKIAGHVSALVCGCVMCVSAILFACFNRSIAGWYLDASNPENKLVIEMASQFLMLAGIFQVFDGLQVSGSLALRGLKDTFAAMLITLFSYWAIGCASGALMCFALGWGGTGLWMGMTLGLATAAVLLLWRFNRRVCAA